MGLSLEEINAKFGDTVELDLQDALAAQDSNSVSNNSESAASNKV